MTQNNMPPISSGEHSDSIATGEHTLFHLLMQTNQMT